MKKNPSHPPRIVEWLLRKLLKTSDFDTIAGDLGESYRELLKDYGKFAALRWFWLQIIISLPRFFRNNIYRGSAMVQNYLKIALRNFRKQKAHSFTNVFGLSIGLSCCILIYLYVAEEFSYDSFHERSESVFRVIGENLHPDGSIKSKSPSLPAVMAKELVDYFPEVSRAVRVNGSTGVIRNNDKILQDFVTFTDPEFFSMFSFQMILGDPLTALTDHNSVVLTESFYRKLFDNELELEKTLTITFGQKTNEYIVSGVISDPPGNSTLQPIILINTHNLNHTRFPAVLTHRSFFQTQIYVELLPKISPSAVVKKFPEYTNQYFTSTINQMREAGNWMSESSPLSFDLQDLGSMHFDTSVRGGQSPVYLYLLLSTGILILAMACINFMNLSVAGSASRFTDIGVRKVLGAGGKQLIRQYTVEAIVTFLIATILGLIFAYFLLPEFNALIGKDLVFLQILSFQELAFLAVLIIIISFAASAYPTLIMVRPKPVEILMGKAKFGGRNLFSKSLIVFQFTLSITLIIIALVIEGQMQFMLGKEVGYTSEGVIVIETQQGSRDEGQAILDYFKNRLQSLPNVLDVSGTSSSFGDLTWDYMLPPNASGDRVSLYFYVVDPNYINFFDLKIIEGRNFKPDGAGDSGSLIVNEKLLRELAIDNPLGNSIQGFGRQTIIGVVKDHNFVSFHNQIGPMALMVNSVFGGIRTILVKVSAENLQTTLSDLKKIWTEYRPNKPFNYSFLDEDLEKQYEKERKWGMIAKTSSLVAIAISCFGLFGLTLITVNQRIKEIGVRKVLGAKVRQLLKIILRDFIIFAVVANIFAWPAAYYFADRFLSNYYYRIDINIHFFLVGGIACIALVILSSFYLAIKAALANPTQTLKNE